MRQLDGEPFERVSLWYNVADGILKLLVANGNAQAPLRLVRGQCRSEQVAELLVPNGTETQILRKREGDSYFRSSFFHFTLLHLLKYRLYSTISKRLMICALQKYTKLYKSRRSI